MSDEATEEMVVIERFDGAAPTYLSEKLGMDYGAGRYGGWANDMAQATRYTRENAQALLEKTIAFVAPHCRLKEVA
jgi:hypothetical protein